MINLIKSTFYNENRTKKLLCSFITDTEKLSMGDQCEKFEEAFAKKQGRKYAVFVSSGSAANLILIQALLNLGYLKHAEKVAFSTLTWATNVMPIIQLGLKPVHLDCEISNLNVSKSILETAYEENPDMKALFITNVLGFCADLDAIEEFCSEKDILLLEDNCESLGSKLNDRHLGNFSMASTFSTYVGHHLSTIEGGFVCTDNVELHDMLVMVRAHGWDRNLSVYKRNVLKSMNKIDDFYAKYTFYDLAYNTRPTEIQGFIGVTQMQYWDEIVQKREENFMQFNAVADENPDIVSIDVDHMNLVSNFAMPVIFKNKRLLDVYKNKFEEAGVETRPLIAGNMIRQPFYTKYVSVNTVSLNADFIHECGLYFGNNPELTRGDVDSLCNLLRKS